MLGPLVDLTEARRAVPRRSGWSSSGSRRGHPGPDRRRAAWAAVEERGRLRDALGAPLPVGVAGGFHRAGRGPARRLMVARYARTHGPFTEPWRSPPGSGLAPAIVTEALRRLAVAGRVLEGEFRPGGAGTEWCDAKSCASCGAVRLAALRQQVEPVPAPALARFLPGWQHVGGRAAGHRRRARAPSSNCKGSHPASASGDAHAADPGSADYSPACDRRAMRQR